jgi:hypothetical protein
MKLKIASIVYLFLSMNLYSQKLDTLIFSTDFEKQVFTKYESKAPVDPLDLFLSINYDNQSPNIKTTISAFIKMLDEKGVCNYARKKQIKEIYSEVHNRFFKKYTEEAYFPDIFKNGTYNCVTASALYALVLDHFKIEYLIKETPNHVYIIADPNSTSFLMETTLPSKGVVEFDDRFKKNYVDYLVSNKIISQNEYKTNSINDLFEKNFKMDKTISINQLAALQYYNKGIFTNNTANYPVSAANFEKANIIFPSNNIKYLYSNALLVLLNEQNSKKKFDGKTLAKYINTNRTNNEAIQLSKDHFKDISSEMVINHPDIPSYIFVYNDLCSSLNDSIDKSDYSQTYHDLLAYYYYTRNDFEKVLDHAGASYQINPENIRTQQFLTEALAAYIQRTYGKEFNKTDSLLKYSEKYPYLLHNNKYVNTLAYSYANELMSTNAQNDEKVLREVQKRFVIFIRKQSINMIDNSIIEGFYNEASSTLVKFAEYDKAEIIIQEGLQFVPNSIFLKGKLETIKNSKKDLKKFLTSKNYPKYTEPEAIKPPEFNAEIVNSNVKKFLVKCWNLSALTKKNVKDIKKSDGLKLIFYPDGKVKFKTGTEEHWGTWKFQNNNSTLTMENNEDKGKFSILIYEASETQMKGIMSIDMELQGKKIELKACLK